MQKQNLEQNIVSLMFADIVVKKGLNLSLVGQSARKILNPKLSKNFSIYPADFHGVFPKLVVKEISFTR